MAIRARRTCLAVPASSERMLAKAPSLGADEAILDLEDAVPPEQKEAARELAVAAVQRSPLAPTTAIRVNARSTPWWADDLRAAAKARPDVVVLPKVESAEDVAAAAELLPEGVGLEAQIETARGLVEAERIAAAGHGLEALVLGPADLAASLGVPVLTIGAGTADYRAGSRRRGRARLRAPAGRRPARAARRRSRPRCVRRARAGARLRREVGDPPVPDRARHVGLHACAGGGRARDADPRGRRRRRSLRGRDGRRGLPPTRGGTA